MRRTVEPEFKNVNSQKEASGFGFSIVGFRDLMSFLISWLSPILFVFHGPAFATVMPILSDARAAVRSSTHGALGLMWPPSKVYAGI